MKISQLDEESRVYFYALGTVFWIGLIMRIFYSHNLGFWNDEIFTYSIINYKLDDFISFYLKGNDFHPPLYYLITKAIRDLIGNSEFGLKLYSVSFFIFSYVVILFFYLRTAEYRSPLFYMFLLISLSAPHIYLSSELRMYSLMSLLAIWLLLLFSTRPGHLSKRQYWAPMIIVFLLSAVHYFGLIFSAISLASWVILNKINKKNVKTVFILTIPTVIYYTLYLPVILINLNRGHPYKRSLDSFLHYLKGMFNHYVILAWLIPVAFLLRKLIIKIKKDPGRTNSQERLFLISSYVLIFSFAANLVYFLITKNSFIVFSTFILFIIGFAFVFGIMISRCSNYVKISFVLIYLLVSAGPIIKGLKDSTYFEPHRLPYRNVLESVKKGPFKIKKNGIILNDGWTYSFMYIKEMLRDTYGESLNIIRIDRNRAGQEIINIIRTYPKKEIWYITGTGSRENANKIFHSLKDEKGVRKINRVARGVIVINYKKIWTND